MSEEMQPDEQISEEQLDDIAGGTSISAQLANLRASVAASSPIGRPVAPPPPKIFSNGQPSTVNPNDPRNITITAPTNPRGTLTRPAR